MKLILSRKGFDSSHGGGPSPIRPDGRLLSFPIPRVPVSAGGMAFTPTRFPRSMSEAAGS
jgi:Nucleotide modification associated domain 3